MIDFPGERQHWLREELEWIVAETEGVDSSPFFVGRKPAGVVAFGNDLRGGHAPLRAARALALQGLSYLDQFGEFVDLDEVSRLLAVAAQCIALNADRGRVKGQAGFHWWPERVVPN